MMKRAVYTNTKCPAAVDNTNTSKESLPAVVPHQQIWYKSLFLLVRTIHRHRGKKKKGYKSQGLHQRKGEPAQKGFPRGWRLDEDLTPGNEGSGRGKERGGRDGNMLCSKWLWESWARPSTGVSLLPWPCLARGCGRRGLAFTLMQQWSPQPIILPLPASGTGLVSDRQNSQEFSTGSRQLVIPLTSNKSHHQNKTIFIDNSMPQRRGGGGDGDRTSRISYTIMKILLRFIICELIFQFLQRASWKLVYFHHIHVWTKK